MRRITKVVFWTTVVGAILYIAFSKYDVIEQLQAQATGKIDTGGASRIWFTPAGELVAIRNTPADLTVRVWSTPADPKGLERKSTVAWDEKRAAARQPGEPIFAVAEDASRVAWIGGAGVRFNSLIKPAGEAAAEIPFKRRVPISGLAFTGSGALAVLYKDGELELWDLAADQVHATTHLDVTDPGPLIANAAYLATYSLSTHDAFVLDSGLGDRLSLIEYKKYPPDILAVALSPQARLAMATPERIEQHRSFISAPGPVRALVFYDRNRVFAAGDFSGVYLLGGDQGPQQIADAPPGTTLIAANAFQLAFGSGQTINLFSHKLVAVRVYRGFGQPSPLMLLALLGLMSPVAIYFIYGAVRLIYRRAAAISLPETAPDKKPEEEGPIPHALIEACQNGDCVLYAGSGLGAQAGLPTWTAFVAELAQWAGEREFPERQQPGAVVDRVAAALEARKQDLYDYLRQRFRVASEIPQSHVLIKEIEFPSVITNSLDNLLDRAFPYSGGRVYTARDCAGLVRGAARHDFFLLKPFGSFDDPETIRLGPAQCAEAVRNNPPFGELMEDLFDSKTFLFIGASLEGLEQDLENLTAPATVTRRHFALVPDVGESWKTTAELLKKRYGIEALTYIPSTPQHPEVVEFLTNLISAIRVKPSTEEYFAANE